MKKKYKVTKKAMRPASKRERCFYCHIRIGGRHEDHCVLINKDVEVEMRVRYKVSVPNFWDKSNIESHRNESSWCANNSLGELEELEEEHGCLCGKVEFSYIKELSGPSLEEG